MHHAMRGSAALAVAALLGAVATPAHADKPAQADKPGQAHAADPAKAQALRGKSAQAHAAAPGQNDEPKAKSEASGLAHEAAELDDKRRGETRAKRQQERREQLKVRYGVELLQRAPIRAELKTHAWRVARLERMRALAAVMSDAAKRQKTMARLDKLTAKENARHERSMEQLRAQGDTTAVALRAEAGGKPENPGKPEHAATPAAPGNGHDKQPEKTGGPK